MLIFFHSGTLSRIHLRPVIILIIVHTSHCKRKKIMVLKGIIIAHHMPTWWVSCNFSHIYSLWISWWGVPLSHACFSYAEACVLPPPDLTKILKSYHKRNEKKIPRKIGVTDTKEDKLCSLIGQNSKTIFSKFKQKISSWNYACRWTSKWILVFCPQTDTFHSFG